MGEVLVDEMSDVVLDFYQSMADRINVHNLYKGKKYQLESLPICSSRNWGSSVLPGKTRHPYFPSLFQV